MRLIYFVLGILLVTLTANVSTYTATSPAYGNLYEDAGSTGITITSAGTYYQWTTSSTSLNVITTLSASTDDITVGYCGEGVYLVNANVSATSAAPPSDVKMAIFINGIRQVNLTGGVTIGVTGEQNMSVSGIIQLVLGDVIDLRFTSDQNGDVITPVNVNLVLTRLRKI